MKTLMIKLPTGKGRIENLNRNKRKNKLEKKTQTSGLNGENQYVTHQQTAHNVNDNDNPYKISDSDKIKLRKSKSHLFNGFFMINAMASTIIHVLIIKKLWYNNN